jgi:phage terminase large subunit-like protein
MFDFAPASADRIARSAGFSARRRSRSGNIKVPHGPWNDRLFLTLGSFPGGDGRGHEDDPANGLVGELGEALLATIHNEP